MYNVNETMKIQDEQNSFGAEKTEQDKCSLETQYEPL